MLAPASDPQLRLRDFLRELETRAKCHLQGIGGMRSLRGPAQFRRIVRLGPDGRPRVAQLPNMDDSDPLYPETGRSICQQLGLDPAEYGF